MAEFTATERALIRDLVEHYRTNRTVFRKFLYSLRRQVSLSPDLRSNIHSLSWRIKHPDHLEDKLKRKLRECKAQGKRFAITKDNLFVKINDLAGLRILHLHTQQVGPIAQGLAALFEEERYQLI